MSSIKSLEKGQFRRKKGNLLANFDEQWSKNEKKGGYTGIFRGKIGIKNVDGRAVKII